MCRLHQVIRLKFIVIEFCLLFSLQDKLSHPFLGGTDFELLRRYTMMTNGNCVISSQVVRSFGPTRFLLDKDGQVQSDCAFLKVLHRQPAERGAVDSIKVDFYPLEVARIGPEGNGGAVVSSDFRSPIAQMVSDLKIQPSEDKSTINATGSDFFKNLNNKGLSKKVVIPSVFDPFWFTSHVGDSSERQFLTGLGELIDCRLSVIENQYVFEPIPERIRQRFRNTYKMFGTFPQSALGLKERIRFLCYDTATDEVIRQTVSNESMRIPVKVEAGGELLQDCEQLRDSMIAVFERSLKGQPLPEVVEMAKSKKSEGKFYVKYLYSFGLQIALDFGDGKVWNL